jgi:hypothetical protein
MAAPHPSRFGLVAKAKHLYPVTTPNSGEL